MTQAVNIPLDSYRLAQYAAQIPCYLCGEGNLFDAELCRHCFAPMALAHQSNGQKVSPKMITTIGASGVGKTVYLGMLLDMLSRQSTGLHALARGAFSITLQQATVAALAECQFPRKTPSEPDRWNWVHCQLQGPQFRRGAEIVLPDLAGEAILEEINHPQSFKAIQSLLVKSFGALVLIDASRLQDGVLEQDFFTMKVLSYLHELIDDPAQGWGERPIALVFSKADQCEHCFDDPTAFAERHSPGLWQHCKKRFRKHRFFAAGVAGACATRNVPGEGRRRVPLRIEPRGILEPFEWLVGQIKG